jgi:hypothetical protein
MAMMTTTPRSLRASLRMTACLSTLLFGVADGATVAPSIQGVGDLPGGADFSRAFGVSADGLVVVGSSASALATSFPDEPFRWTTAGGGMVGLGAFPGGGNNINHLHGSGEWTRTTDLRLMARRVRVRRGE